MLAIFYGKFSDANDDLDSAKHYINDAETRKLQLHLIVKCLKYVFEKMLRCSEGYFNGLPKPTSTRWNQSMIGCCLRLRENDESADRSFSHFHFCYQGRSWVCGRAGMEMDSLSDASSGSEAEWQPGYVGKAPSEHAPKAAFSTEPDLKSASGSSSESASKCDSDCYSKSELESESESPLLPLPKPSPQQHHLNSKGYVVFYAYVPGKLCDDLLAASRSLSESAWSKLIGDGGVQDECRMSAPAPKSLTKELYQVIAEGCETFFSGR
jgi:hypothetical protein